MTENKDTAAPSKYYYSYVMNSVPVGLRAFALADTGRSRRVGRVLVCTLFRLYSRRLTAGSCTPTTLFARCQIKKRFM